MTEWIKKGDIVFVEVCSAGAEICPRGLVLSVPGCTGDPWIIKNLNNGNIHYITEGCTVTLLESMSESFDTPEQIQWRSIRR